MNLFFERDADLSALQSTHVAVLGYGNQGQAHALNLRDSGVPVIVAQRGGSPRFDAARADGFEPMPTDQAVTRASLLILALPDDRMADIYADAIAPHLRPGQTLGFIHGFNIHFRRIVPPASVDVVMVAPKGPGRLVRDAFVAGRGVAGLLAIHQDAAAQARRTALAWAAGIGCTRIGVLETTFAHEAVTDLFGEQTVLCGGMLELMKAAFETLVAAGYPEELAYFECVHEVKQIVDLVYDGGIEEMRRRISSTARYGGLIRGPQMVPDAVRQAMRTALADIESGAFARRFAADTAAGGPEMQRLTQEELQHPLIDARRKLFQRLKLRPPPPPTQRRC